jgi:tetratricopeptide (TPR) repeat protein
LEEAAEQFLVASKKAQNKFQRAFAEFNLGYCRFEMGQLEEAAALLRRVDDSGGLRRNREASALLANHLSTCYALLGDVGAARSMLEEGVRRRTEGYDSHPLLAEVLILCREDHFGAAAKTLESRWREVEMSGGVYLKMLRVLRAFALDTVDPAANAQAVMEALAGAKPLAPATLQTLTAHWPKMREFLVAQKLVAAA